jgi:hypothetical protein
VYIVQTIPRNLAFLCARATEYPSTLELNNRYNRFSMDRAKDMPASLPASRIALRNTAVCLRVVLHDWLNLEDNISISDPLT